jgi:hypothetical protein
MADELKNSENILIKVDEENILYLDPNSLIDDGVVKQRLVQHEKLVMYVNLEADIVPRSRVNLAGDTSKDKTSIVSLYKGNVNFLKPVGSDVFDTSWTDLNSINDKGSAMYASTVSQTFGIRSINIKTNLSMTPTVSIVFVDVRGKTLFESPESSPYKVFFHIPAPLFYLTLKGYYGKSIRYQLALTKFNARFDSSTGNYEVVCDFVSPLAPILSDIPIQYITTAPYMYPQTNRVSHKTVSGGADTQTSTVSKNTSKGYEILKQVYEEYKANGIVPQDFPYLTLRDLEYRIQKLDTLLEKEFFDKIIDPKILSDMDAFATTLDTFAQQLISAGRKYVDTGRPPVEPKSSFFPMAYGFQSKLAEVQTDINSIIDDYSGRLKDNNAFGENRQITTGKIIEPPPTITVNIKKNYLITVNNIPYISIDVLLDQINALRKVYVQNRIPIEQKMNIAINEIVKSNAGIGFEPTTRNIFAVILAGADTFIRLMSDVHDKAAAVAQERSKLIGNNLEGVYPFPQITVNGTCDKPNILVYPGDISVRTKLQSYDTRLWPEVDFIEQYYTAAAHLNDPLIDKESNLHFYDTVFPQDDNSNLTYNEIFTWTYNKVAPYISKTTIGVFYELYERAYIASLYSGLENFASIRQLGHVEADNVKQSITGVIELEQKLKANRNLATLKNELFRLSPFKRWENTKDDIFTTTYLQATQETDFDLFEISGDTQLSSAQYAQYSDVASELQSSSGDYVKNLYPFNSKKFYEQLQDKSTGSLLNSSDFSVNEILKIDNTHGLISNNLTIDNWYFGEKENIFKDSNIFLSGNTISIYNTPYFTNALLKDMADGTYRRTAYLFLNSLPFINLYNKFVGTDKYVFASFNQYAAVHKLPYLWVLKIGSIWNRYKNADYLDVISNNDVETLFDGGINNTLNLKINSITRSISAIDHNVGFYPKYFDTFFTHMHDGLMFFGLTGSTQSDYEASIQSRLDSGVLKIYEPVTNSPHIEYFTAYGNVSGSTYFIFPSNGGLHLDNFNSIRRYQNNTTRLYLGDTDSYEYNFSGFTAPKTNQHFRTTESDDFSFDSDFKSTIDLLATFKPEVLDAFEEEFLRFTQPGGAYTMHSILKSMSTVNSDTPTIEGLRTAQQKACEDISTVLMGKYYHLKLANPKEVKIKALKDFIQHSTNSDLTFYSHSQVTPENDTLLAQIIGEDMDGYYKNFFQAYNIQYGENYFKRFRSVVRYYAGLKMRGISDDAFLISAKTLATSYDNKLDQFIMAAFDDLNKIPLSKTQEDVPSSVGFNDNQTLKLELWNSLKTFNDRWIGGNIIADKTLMNDFLFFDRGNRDIGQKTYINLFRLENIWNEKNGQMSLYGLIGEILQGAGFNFYALPAYVNFFGVNNIGDTGKARYTTSEVASDLFGTFLEVDYVNSSPKFLCQYVGLTSEYLNMNGISDDYKFANDGVSMAKSQDNPLGCTSQDIKDGKFDKSNRVVCFEVNFGDQAQGVFKGISLDQATIKNTAESYKIIEMLAKNESGSNAAQVDTGLFNVYKNRNYTCEVTMLGDAMIQPTMYFQLRNVPMFEGAYLITEVRHEIRDNTVETIFTGTRISKIDLPHLDEIMVSTNKIIFQRLLDQSKVYNKQSTTTQQ